jgi:hypothetical protein
MYPEQPRPPQPVDYLNQIAPHTPKRRLPSFRPGPRLFAIIGAALIILIIIISIVVNSVTTAQRAPLQHLAARLASTTTVVANAQSNIKSSDLRSLNSNLGIYLANTNRDIAAPLLSAGVNISNIPDSVTKAESSTALTARLEDDRLNAVYDNQYAVEMAYQLDTILNLMQQIKESTGNAQLKNFLASAYTNLQPTQKAFADYNAANS